MLERLTVWLARAIWRRFAILMLLTTLGAILAYSVNMASWVQGEQLSAGIWLGLLGGAALARSRFRDRWALPYALVMLMAGAAEQVGRVLPPLAQLRVAPGDWVWNLNLRVLTLGQRVAGWAAAVAAGQPVQDTGLFVWLFSLLVWGAAAWLAWWVLRRGQAFAGLLPATLILAANTHLSAQPWQPLCLFVVVAMGLLVYSNFEQQQADWRGRGVDHPGELGLDWAIAGSGLVMAVGLLSATGPVLATPQGWHLLANLLAAPQHQVAETAGRLFGGVNQHASADVAPLAWTPDLSRIGSAIDQSQATVMWVTVDEAPPTDIPGAPPPPQHYWRAGLYVTYDGAGWQPLRLTPGLAAVETAAAAVPGRYRLQQQFEIVAQHGPDLFAANRPISGTVGATPATDNATGAIDDATTLLVGPASNYTVVSLATLVSEAELRAAPKDYPASVRTAYLQLPDELPSRVRALAAQIVSGARDPYDEALRVQQYLRDTYAYTLDVPPPPPGHDAVDYFLYEAPGGFCSYYASAMAVMLRTLGVPARVATGYAMGEYDADRAAYRVAGAAAHAWVEVYFPGYGWVEFEPTATRSLFTHPAGAVTDTNTPAPPSTGRTPVGGGRSWQIVIGVGLVLLTVAGWWLWQRAEWAVPATPRERAFRLYRTMRRALAQAGLAAGASVTPDEYLQTQAGALAARPALLDAVTETTALFREAAYSQHPVSSVKAAAAQRTWAGARLDWLLLLLARGRRSSRH